MCDRIFVHWTLNKQIKIRFIGELNRPLYISLKVNPTQTRHQKKYTAAAEV